MFSPSAEKRWKIFARRNCLRGGIPQNAFTECRRFRKASEGIAQDSPLSRADNPCVSSRISGRTTAELELALPGKFEAPEGDAALGHEAFSKKVDASGYEVVIDTHGRLLWKKTEENEPPRLILTSESVGRAYLAYLDGLGISWIACGRDRVALARALEFLSSEFGVKRAAVVGGGRINKDFLEAGLIDEVSILIGSGIDGRTGQNALFDGRADDADPVPVRFKEVKTFPSGAVLLRYEVEK